MTGTGVVGTIRSDDAEGLIARDLVQKLGQHRRVADPAASDLNGPDF